jgi:hypothetical protein
MKLGHSPSLFLNAFYQRLSAFIRGSLSSCILLGALGVLGGLFF